MLDVPSTIVVGTSSEPSSAPKVAKASVMGGTCMSASEEMLREQLNRIIARAELRVEQWSIHASALAPYGDEAK
jgi:hypothetical protein